MPAYMSEWIEIPDLDENHEQWKLHIERYKWARNHLKGTIVANGACGTNYAYHILKSPRNVVIGFDKNKDALAIARAKGRDLVIEKDIQEEPFDGFTSLVSLETIEHLLHPWKFIEQLSETVYEVVLSVPIVPTKHINRWHLHDFTETEFLDALKGYGWNVQDKLYQYEEAFKPHITYIVIYAIR